MSVSVIMHKQDLQQDQILKKVEKYVIERKHLKLQDSSSHLRSYFMQQPAGTSCKTICKVLWNSKETEKQLLLKKQQLSNLLQKLNEVEKNLNTEK